MSTRKALRGPLLAVDVLSTPNTFNFEVLMMQDTVDCMLTSPDPVNGVVLIMQDTVDCMLTDGTPDTVKGLMSNMISYFHICTAVMT